MADVAPAAAKVGFFMALVAGPDGRPDEAALSYLAVQLVLMAGAAFNAGRTGHFDLLDLAGAEVALIPLYNAALALRGAIGKGQ